MTEAHEHAAAADVEHGPPPAVPVAVGHDLNVQGQAADYGAWSTITTPAGVDLARPILAFEPARHRATIIVSAPGAVVAGSGVWVGSPAQCQASPPLGGFLPPGSYVVENNQAVWMIGDGTNSMRVTVLQERWDSAGGGRS
jgi:hypothetical protein